MSSFLLNFLCCSLTVEEELMYRCDIPQKNFHGHHTSSSTITEYVFSDCFRLKVLFELNIQDHKSSVVCLLP